MVAGTIGVAAGPARVGQGVAMEFRILGPFEVVGRASCVDLRGAKRRGLVAYLVVHAGQPVSTARLVEELWGDAAPGGAARTIQSYVSQLRKLLGGGPTVQTRPGGYLLELESAAVDAYRFEQGVTAAGADRDPAHRLTVLDDVLGLWRGPPLGEFAGAHWADTEASRLEALRLQALQHRCDALLELGRAGEAVAELERLVRVHPLDERFWAQLMVALYRSGRQADALRVYQELRRHLGVELGIEPGPELVGLERRILEHDPTLAGAAGQPTPASPGQEMDRRELAAGTLPTGTVTFLLTDVEGSSQLWEAAPAAMASAIARHYELLDGAIVRHGGVRPVEQGEGDSVVGAFSRASDAVAASLGAQRALAAEAWPPGAALRVRMALHTGEAQLRDDGNYFGRAVNRCARLRAIGHGGQVLLSDATAALVGDRLAEGATLLDLGTHHLKDLARPERVWQLVHPELPQRFPPLRSRHRFRHNLPAPLTPLIGRTGEVAELAGLLSGERLVTLTGSGGVGKSRLALAVGAEVVGRCPDGVWWVELAAVSDPDAVGRSALAAIGAQELPGASLAQQLAVELGEDESLLMLDNCEHVIEACAELVNGLLRANPSTAVLATSREPLGVPGEITWRVPSLDVPPPEEAADVPALVEYDAVCLFVERARRARPSFAATEANAPALAQICRRLDGIPLAIELAAARCRQTTPERIAVELDDCLRLLTGGARTTMTRHQTLAASIDWSHDRLDETERIAFRRLGVFAGPFPLAAAAALVAAPGDLEPTQVFDLVGRLVDKSLVVEGDDAGGEPRYRLLDTLRAYALDRARAAHELTMLQDAHARWWAAWLDQRGTDMPTDEVVDEVDGYHDNLRAALEWSAAADPALGLRLLAAVTRPWQTLGRTGDQLAVADRLLTTENAQRHPRAWLPAAEAATAFAFFGGTRDYFALLDQFEQLAADIGDEYHAAIARWYRNPYDPETTAVVRDRARERAVAWVEALATIHLAVSLAVVSTSAPPVLAQADALAAASANRYLRDYRVLAHALAAASTGDLPRCIAIARRLLDSPAPAMVRSGVRTLNFAALLACDKDALRLTVEATARVQRTAAGMAGFVDTARHRLRLLEGQPSRAEPAVGDNPWVTPRAPERWLVCREAIDAGAADMAIDIARAAGDSPISRAVLAAVEAAATGDENRWHDALQISLEQGVRVIAVDTLEGVAVAAARADSPVESLRLLAAAARLRDETGYRWRFRFEQQAVQAALAATGEALGDNVDAVTAEGRRLDWRDAAAYARPHPGQHKRPAATEPHASDQR